MSNADHPNPIAAHARWQQRRYDELAPPDSWLGLCGLFWLNEGDNRVGAEADSDVVIPAGAPHVGLLRVRGMLVHWLPVEGKSVLFELGTPGWTHGNLRVLRGQALEDQIGWSLLQYQTLREELLGRPCAQTSRAAEQQRIPPLPATFRFPYGACDQTALDAVVRAGQWPVQWSLVSGVPVRSQSPKALAQHILAAAKPGAIMIAHANGPGWATAQALPLLVPQLRERGYRFVTVSQLLAAGEPVSVDSCYENRPGDNLRYDRRSPGHATSEQSTLKARAELDYANATLAKCRNTAPFSGRVAEQKAREQQFVQPGQALLEILDDSSLDLDFIVPPKWVAWLKVGQGFKVAIDENGQSYPARVTRLGARIDPVSQSVTVAAVIDGHFPELIAGMSGRVLLAPPAR